MSEDDILLANPELSELKEMKGKKSLETLEGSVKYQIKKLKEKKAEIPAAIREAERLRPELKGIDKAELEAQIKTTDFDIETDMKAKIDIETGGAIGKKNHEKSILVTQQLDLENTLNKDLQLKRNKLRNDHEKSRVYRMNIADKIDKLERNVRNKKSDLKQLNKTMQGIIQEWGDVNRTEFIFELGEVCPSGNDCPHQHKLNTDKETAESDFNKKRSENKRRIDEEGTKTAKDIEAISKEIKSLRADVKIETTKKEQLEASDKKELETIEPINFDKIPEHAKLSTEIAMINQNIVDLKNGSSDSVNKLTLDISQKKAELQTLQGKLALFATEDKCKSRLKELGEMFADLNKQIEEKEKVIFMIDQFTSTKVNMLESKINDKFEDTVFTLFERQINGAINDNFCEATYKGVKYSTLNNAGRINCGLDIVKTLKEFYGLDVPVFVDNAESITRIKEVDSQMISFYVDEKFKELTRVES